MVWISARSALCLAMMLAPAAVKAQEFITVFPDPVTVTETVTLTASAALSTGALAAIAANLKVGDNINLDANINGGGYDYFPPIYCPPCKPKTTTKYATTKTTTKWATTVTSTATQPSTT